MPTSENLTTPIEGSHGGRWRAYEDAIVAFADDLATREDASNKFQRLVPLVLIDFDIVESQVATW